MRKLTLVLIAVVLLVTVSCSNSTNLGQDGPMEMPDPSQWQWYTTEESGAPDTGYWEDPTVWDFGTLMPDTAPRIIDGDESFYVKLRGELDGALVFSLNHWGMMPKSWKPRIVELTNEGTLVTIPQWDDYDPPKGVLAITDCRKLDNGNYLVGKGKVGVFEIERSTGEVVHFMADAGTTHNVEQLANGNLLMNNPVDDLVYEKTWEGDIVWSWSVAKNIKAYSSRTYNLWERSLGYRNMYYEWRQGSQWTQVNHVERLENGHHLLSLKNWDIIAEIDEDGNIIWTYGALILKKPHHCTLTAEGNILLHDTGNNRVIEVNREHEIVWEYSAGMISPMAGIAQRKDNGNTVILECFRSAMFEVKRSGECVWEMTAVAKPDATLAKVPTSVTPGYLIFRGWWYEGN